MKWLGKEKRRFKKVIEKRKRLSKWHKWFAWYPVIVGKDENNNENIIIWLEFVQRKAEYYFSGFFKETWIKEGHNPITTDHIVSKFWLYR